jgi:hypothetical protein
LNNSSERLVKEWLIVQVVCSFSVYSYLVWRVTGLVLLLLMAWGLSTALFLLGVAQVSSAPFLKLDVVMKLH